ncbi:Hypothetical predicted protein, partial [Mytilus galloprovincialis]
TFSIISESCFSFGKAKMSSCFKFNHHRFQIKGQIMIWASESFHQNYQRNVTSEIQIQKASQNNGLARPKMDVILNSIHLLTNHWIRIGTSKDTTSENWRWIQNGKMNKMKYKAFGTNQPDGSNAGPQDCMFFYAPERYILHDMQLCFKSSASGGYGCRPDYATSVNAKHVCFYPCRKKLLSFDECRYPFRTIGDSCYFISKEKATPDQAFALCLRHGAYLANFETLEEAMLMKYKLQQMKTGLQDCKNVKVLNEHMTFFQGLHFHVGGRNINRYVPGGDWRWIKNGKMNKMTYKAFGSGQPDGTNASPQDCMFFYAGERYAFHNLPFSPLIYFEEEPRAVSI